MELEFTADDAGGEVGLYIHLDVQGLAALLKAVEAAMSTGRGELSAAAFGAPAIGASGDFGRVTFTFAERAGPSDDAGPVRLPDAGPLPGIPAFALQV
jgi:hypothetical protein